MVVKSCEVCEQWFRTKFPSQRYCSPECSWENPINGQQTYYDPSPAEIAEEAAAIRSEWTEEERLRRLRYTCGWCPAPSCSGSSSIRAVEPLSASHPTDPPSNPLSVDSGASQASHGCSLHPH